jgi:hypothetical protein
MWNRLVSGPLVFPYLAAGVCAAVSLGLVFQNQLLLPLLNTAIAYPVLFALVAGGRHARAYGTMLFWALCLTVCMICATVQFPLRAEATVFNGRSYAQEMMRWVQVGDTRENRPAQFIPQHLLHLSVFAVLSLVSGSALSLLMGAVLTSYMSFYVGSLILTAHHPGLAAAMGWQPYAVIRVASYVILGIILGEPLICRITKRKYDFSRVKTMFWIALAGIVLDIVIKSLIAPWWGLTLRRFL